MRLRNLPVLILFWFLSGALSFRMGIIPPLQKFRSNAANLAETISVVDSLTTDNTLAKTGVHHRVMFRNIPGSTTKTAFEDAVKKALTVPVAEFTAFQPDAGIYCCAIFHDEQDANKALLDLQGFALEGNAISIAKLLPRNQRASSNKFTVVATNLPAYASERQLHVILREVLGDNYPASLFVPRRGKFNLGFALLTFADKNSALNALELVRKVKLLGGSVLKAHMSDDNELYKQLPPLWEKAQRVPRTQQPMQEKHHLFLGNLPYEVNKFNLGQLLDSVIGKGGYSRVTVPVDRVTRRPKGIAYVAFQDEAQLHAAKEKLSYIVVRDREIRVDIAEPPSSQKLFSIVDDNSNNNGNN